MASPPTLYVKRPIAVAAVKIENATDVFSDVFEAAITARAAWPAQVTVKTAYGPQTAAVGDWLIQGPNGEVYPCPGAVFEATYALAAPLDFGDLTIPPAPPADNEHVEPGAEPFPEPADDATPPDWTTAREPAVELTEDELEAIRLNVLADEGAADAPPARFAGEPGTL